jgi:hypothetical protein
MFRFGAFLRDSYQGAMQRFYRTTAADLAPPPFSRHISAKGDHMGLFDKKSAAEKQLHEDIKEEKDAREERIGNAEGRTRGEARSAARRA